MVWFSSSSNAVLRVGGGDSLQSVSMCLGN